MKSAQSQLAQHLREETIIMRRSIGRGLAFLVFALAVVWLLRSFRVEDRQKVDTSNQATTSEVRGQVVDADGPVSGAD